ncbi:quinol:cytochrome C oxidoreductase [Rosettibacter firmus]|uniref:quinol:cytochrome C oxidoreductase n=1 Tax=Rosettibacter firmus TaxID=3111522 RepID=UPI00336BB942
MSNFIETNYTKKEIPEKFKSTGIILLLLGLIGIALSYYFNPIRASYNNIIILLFLISIGLGSMFLISIEYLSGAVWSVPFRRIPEFLSGVVLLLPVIVLPLLFNMKNIFEWLHPEILKVDPLLQNKAPYLNSDFFIVRVIIFISIWILFFYLFTKNSFKQDLTGEQLFTKKNIKYSALFLPLFAITITFTAIDWLMSLEPHWFSTIFGVYYFSGTVVSSIAASTITIILLNERGYLVKGLSGDHYYSLGALLFAFINFWAYIAFSQYLLIWYANLPEETIWFLNRWQGNWKYVSIGLIIIHFVVPYFGLLSQPSKMNPKRLLIMSSIILFAHYYDLYWMAMPNFSKNNFIFSWSEISFILFTVGTIILIFYSFTKKYNLIPIGDPKLKRGIEFKL